MSAWTDLFMQALGMAAGFVILHRALPALDGMNKDTSHGVRIAFLLLATGGFAQIIDPWIAHDLSHGADVLLSTGLATLLVFDRRCTTCPRAEAVKGARRRRDPTREDGELA